MFTGIIEEVGKVQYLRKENKSANITICANEILEDVKIGDSIAVNGACLTVTHITSAGFSADIMPETVERTALSSLRKGEYVNLERAMKMGGRFHGHIVTGHIDSVGIITVIKREEIAVRVTIKPSQKILRYIVEKGSIAVDGISLTVARVTEKDFTVSLIPHTAAETTLLRHSIGNAVNLECDLIGKYVEKLQKNNLIDKNFLSNHGF